MYFWVKCVRISDIREEGINMRREERYRRRRMRRRLQLIVRLSFVFFIVIIIAAAGMKFLEIGPFRDTYVEREVDEMSVEAPELDVQLLTVNAYSRPGSQSDKINNIVIHYTANPGTTAMQNRNYFEGLKDSRETKASSHFIVGLDGEIVQCVPTWEIAYASNDRNHDTVSVETCHYKADGAYTEETYESLVQLTAWLCEKFGLTEEDVIRHYDITGKNCPKYFVENEGAWEQFRKDVKTVLGEN